jgi:integrase
MKHYKDGFKPLKTDSSERTITIDSKLMEMLKPFIEAADPFVFGGVHPLATSKIDTAFRKGIKDANLKPIRLHDLRHSHASFLLNNGANILAVSKRLGHATITQTLETYAHLMQDTDEKMMKIIESEKDKKSE